MKTEIRVWTLEELILSDKVKLGRGDIISKRDIANCPGEYPIYSSAREKNGTFGFYGKYMFDEELITWSIDGGGRLFYRPRHKFSVTNVGGTLRILDKDFLDCRYLHLVLAYLHSKEHFDWVYKAHPSVIRMVYKEIPIPSLEKQREIVERLDRAFAEVDLLEKNLKSQFKSLSEVAAEKLDQIFNDIHAVTYESQKVKLSEIARVINGRAYSQPELLKEGPYPVLRVGNFFSNRGWYYSDLELDKDKYCDDGDLLYAWSASFGPRIWDGGKVIYHYHIWKIEEDASLVIREWLYWWFLWDVNQIKKAHGTGSTMMHITKGAMESRALRLPSLLVQAEQVSQISTLLSLTTDLEKNYLRLTQNYVDLRSMILASAFQEAVA